MTEPHEGNPAMSPADFEAWLAKMGFSQRDAAKALGLARNTVARCLREGADRTVALACAALAAGLEPWRETVEEVDWNEREALVKAAFNAPSLAALYVAVTEYEGWHERNRRLDDRVDELTPDMTRLPTFGGDRPEADDVDTVMSWDEKAVLTRQKGTHVWSLSARA